MKRYLAIVAAGALTFGGYVFAQNAPADQPNAIERTGKAIEHGAEKTGEAIKEGAEKAKDAVTPGPKDAEAAASKNQSKHAEEIHDVMAQVTEAALTKNGLDDMTERFTEADRKRLNENKDALKADDTINGRIDEFRKDWKAKYNQDFNLKDEDKIYNLAFATITEGAGNEARTAGATVSGDVKVDENKPAADAAAKQAAAKNANSGDVATLHIVASHNKPALEVPFIHEAGGWRIDIPDSVDAAKFHQNVLNALTHCDEMKDQWPSDVNDAYRAVTHAVLLATFDKPLDDKSAGAAGASGTDTNALPSATPAK